MGSDFLKKYNAKWDFENQSLRINDSVVILKTKNETENSKIISSLFETVIPPHTSQVINCHVKRKNGEVIASPLNNALIFERNPGLLSAPVVTQIKNFNCVTLLTNSSNRRVKIRKGEVLARTEIYEGHQAPTHKQEVFQVQESPLFDFSAKLPHLNSELHKHFEKLLKTNSDLFARSETDLGKTSLVKMKIETSCEGPIKQKPYKTPFSQRPLVEKQINDLLDANIIRQSNSPWASPIIMVPKKDGGHRMCIDYRKLNQVTKQNSYPLPDISDILSSMNSAKIFSCLDLKSGYYQIQMEEKDKPKTAFVCFKGLFEFNVLPFGLCAAPPVFQELMNRVLKPALNKFAFAYIDDIIIYSKDANEHIKHLQIVFDLLRDAGLKLKLSKCEFGVEKVKYLGHEISKNGINPDPEKIAVIKKLQYPRTIREVRSFLGMAGYYRRFIRNFAETAFPLTQLTKKYGRFKWGPECENAFNKLKECLCETVTLAHPDTIKPYNLYTDASDYAVGAVLTQELEGGEKVIQFLSKQLDDGQRKWATIEKEAYAIVYAVNKLRPFLYGSKFTVFTDHKPLRTLFTSEMKNARIQRWAIMLSEYGCNIEYKKGKENIPADMLSRIEDTREIKVIDSSENTDLSHLENGGDMTGDGDLPNWPPQTPDCLKNIKQLQKDDKYIHDRFECIRAGIDLPDYIIEDDLLYHIMPVGRGDKASRLQLVIPESIKRVVLEHIHCSMFGAGHFGADKTYDCLRARYFWPNMYKETHEFVARCDLCNERKRRFKTAPIMSMPVPNYPFEIIGIDICGPFTETEDGNIYVLTIIDHFSGWPEAFAMQNKSTISVARILLNEIIPRHGCPRVIVSDRGTEFTSATVALINEKMRISHVKTSPYHPQSNGKTERFHRYMNDSLAKYSRNAPFQWDLYVPAMLMAYRTMTHSTTQKSPFLVIYGRDPVLPIDTLLQPKLRYMGDEFVPTQLQRLHEVYNDVKNNIESSQQRNQEIRNQNASKTVLTAGDAVYYRDRTYQPGISTKLQPKWAPFYRVVEQTGPVNFRIRHQFTNASKVVHVDNLMRAYPEDCWEKQWEEYAKFTSSKSAVDPPVVRKQPHRAAKLATPTVVQPNLAAVPLGPQTTPTGSASARPVQAIPPIVLHRTDDRGWAIHDDTESPQDAEEEMDVNIILGIERFLFPIRFI